jgi:hypothetical protein
VIKNKIRRFFRNASALWISIFLSNGAYQKGFNVVGHRGLPSNHKNQLGRISPGDGASTEVAGSRNPALLVNGPLLSTVRCCCQEKSLAMLSEEVDDLPKAR